MGWSASLNDILPSLFVGRRSSTSMQRPPTADVIRSIHRMGDVPRSLVSSTLPCMRRRSMVPISRLETSEYDIVLEQIDVACSWNMETFVRNSVSDYTLAFFFRTIYTERLSSSLQIHWASSSLQRIRNTDKIPWWCFYSSILSSTYPLLF